EHFWTARAWQHTAIARRHLERDHRPDRADHSLLVDGRDPALPPDGPFWNARVMSDLSNVAAPPRSVSSNKLRFYGSWIATAIALLALPYIFSSGGSLTTFSLIGISIIFSLSYNIL